MLAGINFGGRVIDTRYSSKKIAEVWSSQHKFDTYFEVEKALIKALQSENKIPSEILLGLDQQKVDLEDLERIEEEVKHDVIAFKTTLMKNHPANHSKWFHFGATSSDIIDTATNLQIIQTWNLLREDIQELDLALETIILRTKETLCLGRSHGMAAEPMIMAHKFLIFKAQLKRASENLARLVQNDLRAKFSGAVGNYTVLSPEVEEKAAKNLGLKVEPISNQVIQRDHYARLIGETVLIAETIEGIAVELRHLSRHEVAEVSESFAKGQKGSSTMPQKKNPVSSENLSGMARILRGHLIPIHENVVLWHERDISHSCVERIIFADHFELLSYSLQRMAKTLNNLEIHKEKTEQRVRESSKILASYYLHQLIAKTQDLSRENLYAVIQKISFELESKASWADFFHKIKSAFPDAELKEMNFEQLKKHYQKRFNKIYNRFS